MLAKVIPLRATKGFSAKAVANYIAENRPQKDAPELHSSDPTAVAEYIGREGISEGGSFNLDRLDPTDTSDRALIVAQMDHIARAGRSKTGFGSNPYYHFVLSWREGERPSAEQAQTAAQHALEALHMQEAQAIFAIHRDKEHHHHIHVVVSRVNPDTLTLCGPPRYDYLVLDRACREIELAQGWQHDHGPHVVIDGRIQRLTRSQREKLGLLLGAAGKAPSAARMAESKSGLPSLAAWARAYVAYELVDAPTWEDLHIALARRGLRLEKLKSGLAIAALGAGGRETRTKASAIDYRLALGRLEKRLGPYRDFQPTGVTPALAMTYAAHLEAVMRGVEPAAGEMPARTGQAEKRRRRREERAAERTALYERYAAEKALARNENMAQRTALSVRHREARRQLARELTARKSSRVSELVREHGKQVALALWAAERAQAMQNLQASQHAEKAALRRTSDMSWKPWIERQAAAGDTAAEAALRGIRYREQRRAKAVQQPGFEGEDLDDSLEGAPAARRGREVRKGAEPNGIGGEQRVLDLTRFEIDRLRQIVTYRDGRGVVALEDLGQRIECRQPEDEAVIRAGLMLASQKYGGEVFITGNDEFRARAAEIARRLGVRIANPELGREPQEAASRGRGQEMGR